MLQPTLPTRPPRPEPAWSDALLEALLADELRPPQPPPVPAPPRGGWVPGC